MASSLNHETEFASSYGLCIDKVAGVLARDRYAPTAWRMLYLGAGLSTPNERIIMETPIGSSKVEKVIRAEYGGRISFPISKNTTINGVCSFVMRELAAMLEQRRWGREMSSRGTLLMLGENSSGEFPEDFLVDQHVNWIKEMTRILEPKDMAGLGMLFLRKQGQRVDFYK